MLWINTARSSQGCQTWLQGFLAAKLCGSISSFIQRSIDEVQCPWFGDVSFGEGATINGCHISRDFINIKGGDIVSNSKNVEYGTSTMTRVHAMVS